MQYVLAYNQALCPRARAPVGVTLASYRQAVASYHAMSARTFSALAMITAALVLAGALWLRGDAQALALEVLVVAVAVAAVFWFDMHPRTPPSATEPPQGDVMPIEDARHHHHAHSAAHSAQDIDNG